MNTTNTILRRYANRIPGFSHAAMATMTSHRTILPLNGAITKSNTISPILPLRPSSPYCDDQKYINRCYSVSTTTLKEENKGNEMGDTNSADTANAPLSSPLATSNHPLRKPNKRKKKFVPQKAAVELTEKARVLFKKLLENQPSRDGILLNYNQSSTGEPRMVFSFRFVSKDDLDEQDEGVSLEVDAEGKPKLPKDALDDGLPKLYVHHNAFLKVLGATVDVDPETITPVLYDKEGFELDANA